MVKILSRMLDVCPSSFMTYKMQQRKHYKCVLFTVQYVFIIFNIPLYKVFKIIRQNLRFLSKKINSKYGHLHRPINVTDGVAETNNNNNLWVFNTYGV